MQGLGCKFKKFNNKDCRAVPTILIKHIFNIYGDRNHVNLCLQGSGDLRMYSSQTDQNIAQILLFLDDLLMSYQTFSVTLSFIRCGIFVAGGA